MIKYFKPTFDERDNEAVLRVMSTGHLTQGEEVKKFEQEFAEYIKAPYVIAVDNCTNALWLALRYLYETKGMLPVRCPAMTFASVAHAITQNNHLLRFVDEYRAGSAYQLGGTNIWDCAHEVIPFQKGQIQCYSFYPNKVLASAEGGAIATDNKKFAEWARLARNNGRLSRTTYDYDILFPGWKMNMTDLQAAIAREQLKKLPEMEGRREEIRRQYKKELEQANRGSYLFVTTVKDREQFMKAMLKDGVETSYHYKPLYQQKAYWQVDKNQFPVTEMIKDHIVSLPIYPQMTDEEIKQVIKLTKKHAK